MAIDKSIRIQDLPESDFLNNDNLIIVNDSDNITRSVTFEDFIGSITSLPGGITLPISDPGFPGLSFCGENTPDCGTGIGSQADCQLFISVCGYTLVEFGPGELVTINGDLQVGGDLIIEEDSFLKGNVNIGTGCAGPEKFTVLSETVLNCKTDILGDTTIGTAPCQTTLEVNATSIFNCETDFNSEVDFKGDITVGGNLQLGGNIVPPPGGSIDVILDDITINGNAIIGKPPSSGEPGCTKNLDIYNKTYFYCDAHSDRKITLGSISTDPTVPKKIELDSLDGSVVAESFAGDGSLLTNLNIPGSLTFKGNINVTDSSSPALVDPQVGDLYLNSVTGLAHVNFVGIANTTVEINRFVFYTAFGEWDTGSVQNQDGFVTLSTPQSVSGDKTFSGLIQTRPPSGTIQNQVVTVGYLKSYTKEEIDDVSDEFVTLDTNQTITGVKNFSEVVRAKTPTADAGSSSSDPNAVVTIEYLTGGGFIGVWNYDTTTKVLDPVANGADVKMQVAGSGRFGHIDLSNLTDLADV